MATKRNATVTVSCEVCGTIFNPWAGRETTSRVCSLSCNGVSLRGSKTVIDDVFWKRVQKSDDCWEWIGGLSSYGYGVLSRDNRLIRAHRVSFEMANGPIPSGMFICHHCDNRKCVRPDHLFVGTQADNVRDMVTKDRHNKKPNVFGERHPLSKITVETARKIRAAQGTNAAVAAEFGVSQSLVFGIRRGTHWKHA